jgi:F-type H+-transporting ATPase subunit b
MPQLEIADFAPQLIWLTITFVTLYLVMARIALPRIGAVIEERRDRIADDLDQAEQLKQKTEKAIAAYEQALAQSRAEAAEARIAQARDAALSQVNDIASDAATNIVSSLIGSKLTKPEVSAAVAKALAE